LLHLSGTYPKITLNDETGVDRAFSVGTNNETFTIRNETGSADVLAITNTNNVGIGTSSPAYKLQANGSGTIARFTDGTSHMDFYAGSNLNEIATASPLLLSVGGTEAFRVDSSQNLLINTTDSTLFNNSGSGNGGIVLAKAGAGAGRIDVARDGNCYTANRLATDGNLFEFMSDGLTAGSIGTTSGRLYIGDGDVALRFAGDLDFIAPWNASTNAARDDAIDLGNAGNRFDDIYATNGTIQTSDRNEKQDIEALSDAEQRVAVACKGLLRKFRWKSSVVENGDDARIHFGIIAQDLQVAFEAEGLDAGRYAMFINSTWTDEETGEERSRMGVRYSELLAFIIAAI
jgi:hypothetical protein